MRTMPRTSQRTLRGWRRKSHPASGGEERLPTPRPAIKMNLEKFVLSPMKNMEESRPVMFMWCDVHEKPVPNCQEAKNPINATCINKEKVRRETYPCVEGQMVDGGEDDEEDCGDGAAEHAEHKQGGGQQLGGQEDRSKAADAHSRRVERVRDCRHVRLELQGTTHPKGHRHRLEDTDDCSGEGEENDDQKEEDPFLDKTQFSRSVVLATSVGIFVVELWHRD